LAVKRKGNGQSGDLGEEGRNFIFKNGVETGFKWLKILSVMVLRGYCDLLGGEFLDKICDC